MDEGKALALKKFDDFKNKGLVYALRDEIESTIDEYKPTVTVVEFEKDDFFQVGKDTWYPSKSATNKIAEAAGVSYTDAGSLEEIGKFHELKIEQDPEGWFQVVGEYAIRVSAQAYRLKADGTPRNSSKVYYEYNVCDRVNIALLKDFKNYKKFKTRFDVQVKLIEEKKFALRCASTGAQLAAAREIAGIPTAWKTQDINKPMMFSHVIRNPEYQKHLTAALLKTPEGRKAVAEATFGTTSHLYGQEAAEAARPSLQEHSKNSDFEPMIENDPFDEIASTKESELTEWDRMKLELEQFLISDTLPPKGVKVVKDALSDPRVTEDRLKELINKCRSLPSQGGTQ
jgi:hypothetical protein